MQYTFVTKFLPVDFEGTLYNSVHLNISWLEWGRNWKYSASCSTKTAHKLV